MKYMTLRFLLFALLMALFPGFGNAATLSNKFGVDNKVCDPVLIYTGGLAKRAIWTKPNLRPYVTHLYADGHRDWFYDAFIFNETNWYDEATNETRVLVNAGGGQLPATKADWEAYLDHIFSTVTDLGALDDLIGEMKVIIGEPVLKHKVIIGLCFPCKDGRGTPTACTWKKFNFGVIDGVDMDFSNIKHRIIASKWFVDEVIRRFEERDYKNIELAGLYTPEETMYTVGDFMAEVNDYIKSKGLNTYWIPYWTNNDQYALEWKDTYHFDIAYRQPNYFFYGRDGSLPPFSQLTTCIRQSKLYGLGLELEFETQDKSNGLHSVSPEMHQRLVDYIDQFENLKVWAESGVAHYSGSKGLIDMVNNGDQTDNATMDRLCDFVAMRKKAFAAQHGVSDVITDAQVDFVHFGDGYIYINDSAPAATVHTMDGRLVHAGCGYFYCQTGLYIVNNGAGKSIKAVVP